MADVVKPLDSQPSGDEFKSHKVEIFSQLHYLFTLHPTKVWIKGGRRSLRARE